MKTENVKLTAENLTLKGQLVKVTNELDKVSNELVLIQETCNDHENHFNGIERYLRINNVEVVGLPNDIK